MNKVFVVCFMFLSCCIMWTSDLGLDIKADYGTYQDIEFEHKGGRLLEDFSDKDFTKYYGKLGKKRFWGWRTYIVQENEKVFFTSNTLYVIINEGTSAISESIKFTRESSVKRQYSVSGTIGLTASGSDSGFKLGLEDSIDYTASKSESDSFEETYSIKVDVDPNTRLTISIKGEGKVTNGVGRYYRFFRNVKKGGWEIFVLTTEYYSLEKVMINQVPIVHDHTHEDETDAN